MWTKNKSPHWNWMGTYDSILQSNQFNQYMISSYGKMRKLSTRLIIIVWCENNGFNCRVTREIVDTAKIHWVFFINVTWKFYKNWSNSWILSFFFKIYFNLLWMSFLLCVFSTVYCISFTNSISYGKIRFIFRILRIIRRKLIIIWLKWLLIEVSNVTK